MKDKTTMFNYEVVSMAVILRDITDPKYINEEHKKLVDIADTLYNANIGVEYFKEDYKELYNKYNKDNFWQNVLQDAGAIDTQLQGHENELIEAYNEAIKA